MSHLSRNRSRLSHAKTLATTICLIAAVSASAVTQGAEPTKKRVVATAENEMLDKTVLTTLAGRTLYSLSVERNGKFVCTSSCLSAWPPLRVPANVKPTGPVKLGTIVRPDGRTQVTYRGRPLYRFAGDQRRGDVNGEGIKDVGVWHAAIDPTAASSPQPEPPSPPPAYPYPYPRP
jgi:predicted lipoprotein with Yx(FWY)xxD motif